MKNKKIDVTPIIEAMELWAKIGNEAYEKKQEINFMNILITLAVLAVIMPILYEVNTVLFVACLLVFIIIGFFWILYD